MARVEIVDYTGHPFTAELGASLHRSGVSVGYTFCSSNDSGPQADWQHVRDQGLAVTPIDLGRSFEKHSAAKRLRDELHFGLKLLRTSGRPEVVVGCQLPVFTAWLVLIGCRLRRQTFVLWLQDFQADLAAISGSSFVAKGLGLAERTLIRFAPSVVCISDGFESRCRAVGRSGPTSVLPNWAPIERLPVADRVNSWSETHGLSPSSTRVVYSGTLGTKHRAEELLALVRSFDEEAGVEFVFVAVGAGIDSVSAEFAKLNHVRVLPLQPYEDLPNVLGSADVLLVTLDESANEACVPSKVLSYLCAGRRIFGLMNSDNPSSKLIAEAEAGEVFESTEQLASAIRSVQSNDAGSFGRRYAELNFSEAAVVARFKDAASVQ